MDEWKQREAIIYALVSFFLALYWGSGHILIGRALNGLMIIIKWD